MENIALIGIDLGKNSFHIHCQDHRGKAVYRKKIHPTKANRISGDMPGNNHRDGSLWRFSLYGTQAGRVRAFSKADITAICPPIR
ncbi:Uncharacterised protein [Citrobacter koseri]|nr:hypothetical protein [Escherichia coli]STB39163.1 Uncharacterised protein [Citrobacter koseri]